MTTIAERVDKIEALKQQVRTHPMCLTFEEDETHYRAIYPAGMCLGGAQAAFRTGKGAALERLLIMMERHWRASCSK